MGARLQAFGLEKFYGQAAAVDGVDLDAQPGEFVSLLGPSGCGKTTSLRMVAGLERPDAGRITIDGRDVTQQSPQSRGLGMVFQQYALFPNLSAFENIAFALRVRRKPQAEVNQRVSDLLSMVHLEDAADRYPHQLSGGMQQRVALARALAMEPPLLLLDEPLSALDAAIRDELRTELRRLQRQLDLTVIYVTHDQAEAMALSDRIVVMEKGKVSQVGSPRDLYNRPATRFAAGFIGANNRRVTTLDLINSQPAVRWGNAYLPVTANGRYPAGSTVLAAWRPEAAAITTATRNGPGVLRGEIELVTFLGPITRFDIVVPGDEEPILVDLVSSMAQNFAVGQQVAVTVPPEAIRVYS